MNINDNNLANIAKYLKILARIAADKQIAYLKCQIKVDEHEMNIYSTDRNIIPLREKINLYQSKIKEYESYFNNEKEVN